MTRRAAWRGAAAAVLLLAGAGAATAGMDVSLERELQSLMEAERQVEALPAYRESEDIREQIRALWQELEDLAQRNPTEIDVARETLRRQIATLGRQLGDLQKTIVDFREQMSRGERDRFFPDVRHRIAVFTFDDPHATGLGDAVSFILSKKLLFSTRVSSFAIVNYAEGVGRGEPAALAYFDRVDALTRDQAYLLAVWGRLSRTADGVRIDSFLQVPADVDAPPYVRRLRLPEAMGGGTLTVRLKPDRIPVQHLDIAPRDAEILQAAAARVAELRAAPSAEAAVTARLEEDRTYRIVDGRGDWVQLRFDDGTSGWTSVDAFCTGACRRLMDVATFANDMVALTAGLRPRPVPDGLTAEAAAMAEQLAALGALADDPRAAAAVAAREVGTGRGSAGFANLSAVARLSAGIEAERADAPSVDGIRLEPGLVEAVAADLATASVADPGDIDIVENLAVLFSYLGDVRREEVALAIAASLRAR